MSTNLARADFALLTHLQATWNRAPRERADPYLSVQRERRSFPLVLQFDPTGGRYFSWLSMWRRQLWDTRGFQVAVDFHELDEVRRALARFDEIRDRLPRDRRDIGQYRKVEDLQAAVPSRMAESLRRMEAAALKREAYRQSEVLFHQERWMVVRIDSFVAARFWGLGTRWCTTTSEGTYRQYATGGRLVVFLTPGGRYQLATRKQMFRDERDQPVDRRAFLGAPKGFLALLLFHRSC